MLALALLLSVRGLAADVVAPPAAPSLIILPDARQVREISGAPSLILPPSLAAAAPAAIILPGQAAVKAPEGQPLIQPATQADLARLTSQAAKPASQAPALQAAFDGSRAPADADYDEVRRPNEFFASGPRAPELPALEATTRSLFQRLLPGLYRPVKVSSVYVPSKLGPGAAHYWTAEEGHVIEVTPAPTDREGRVESVIGEKGNVVQQKIEQLVQYFHEYAHAVFDDAMGKNETPGPDLAFTSMTEGFATTLERLFIEELLNNAPALGLSVRDADDLRRIDQSRRRWLSKEDTAYSEGTPIWRRAHEDGGAEGIKALLGHLSFERLMRTPRADPVYQLALGDNELLSAYLGRDKNNPRLVGLEAYSKAVAGAALFSSEAEQASAAIEAAGPGGRRRVFERVLSRADLFETTSGNFWIVPHWLREGSDSVAPAFLLADLNPTASSELAEYLAQAARTPHGLERIFEKAGPSQRLTDVISRAEKLNWKPADRAAWDAAISAWLLK